MRDATEADRVANHQSLVDENHDLSGFDDTIRCYLQSAGAAHRQSLRLLERHLQPVWPSGLAIASRDASVVEEGMTAVFDTLRTSLAVGGDDLGAQERLLETMMNYKKSLFALRDRIDQSVAEVAATAPSTTNGPVIGEIMGQYLASVANVAALSGLGALHESGLLHKILLKLTFSLASIDIVVPFVGWAPSDVVDHFWEYLDIQRATGLQVKFVDFYQDPGPYRS